MQSILFVNYEYPPLGGGAGNASYHLASEMAKQGKRVCVLTSAYRELRGRAVENGVIVYRVRALRRNAGRSSLVQMLLYDISAAIHLFAVVKREQPECAVIFFSFPCGPLGLFIRLFRNVPYVVMLRGGDVPGFEPSMDRMHRLLRPVRRMVYKNSRAIVANSEALRALAQRADPGYAVGIIKNGVDTEFFAPPDAARPAGTYTFLFSGRFCAQKNVGTLIDAFGGCHAVHAKTRLVLVGEGPEAVSLRRHAEATGAMHAVRFIDWCKKERLRELYRCADCFTAPSHREGMSNAVLEAMACGLPVICGDCEGNREVIVDGKNGFLVAAGDVAALSERMLFCSDNRQKAAEIGAAARKYCCERFSWSMAAHKLTLLLEEGRQTVETI